MWEDFNILFQFQELTNERMLFTHILNLATNKEIPKQLSEVAQQFCLLFYANYYQPNYNFINRMHITETLQHHDVLRMIYWAKQEKLIEPSMTLHLLPQFNNLVNTPDSVIINPNTGEIITFQYKFRLAGQNSELLSNMKDLHIGTSQPFSYDQLDIWYKNYHNTDFIFVGFCDKELAQQQQLIVDQYNFDHKINRSKFIVKEHVDAIVIPKRVNVMAEQTKEIILHNQGNKRLIKNIVCAGHGNIRTKALEGTITAISNVFNNK